MDNKKLIINGNLVDVVNSKVGAETKEQEKSRVLYYKILILK